MSFPSSSWQISPQNWWGLVCHFVHLNCRLRCSNGKTKTRKWKCGSQSCRTGSFSVLQKKTSTQTTILFLSCGMPVVEATSLLSCQGMLRRPIWCHARAMPDSAGSQWRARAKLPKLPWVCAFSAYSGYVPELPWGFKSFFKQILKFLFIWDLQLPPSTFFLFSPPDMFWVSWVLWHKFK